MNQEELRNAFLNAGDNKGEVLLDGEDFTDAEFAAAVSDLPPLPQLKTLSLKGTQVGNEGVKALADAAKAKGLQELQTLLLDGTLVGDEGLKALADAAKAKGLPQLKTLSLKGTQVGNEGVKALADAAKAGGFPQLQDLDLRAAVLFVNSKLVGV
jgi:Ran GTPase-activating protein (RanGAP) involved in mRNA processing and transport